MVEEEELEGSTLGCHFGSTHSCYHRNNSQCMGLGCHMLEPEVAVVVEEEKANKVGFR